MQNSRWETIEAWMAAYGDSILRTVYLVTRDGAASAAYERFLELTADMDLPERLRQEAEHGAGLAPR